MLKQKEKKVKSKAVLIRLKIETVFIAWQKSFLLQRKTKKYFYSLAKKLLNSY